MGAYTYDRCHSDESFIRSLNHYTPISKAEEYALIGQAQDGDSVAVHKLIEQHNRQVLKIAKRLVGRGLPLWDLFSEGRMGLLKAIDKFDMDRGCRLSTYAAWWIRQMMTRALQNQGRTVRIPVHAHEFHKKVMRAIHDIKRDNESEESPDDETVAEWMCSHYGTQVDNDLSQEKIVEKIRKVRNSPAYMTTSSLETPIDCGGHTQLKEVIPEEIAPDGIRALLDGEHRDAIGSAIDKLKPKERYVIHMRFFLGWTLEQIAETMLNRWTKRHLTRERVRQIEDLAVKRLQFILNRWYRTERS